MNNWTTVASNEQIRQTVDALKKGNIETTVVETGQEAKQKVIELLPKAANVSVNTSITLDTIGISQLIDESGEYDSQRKKWLSVDRVKEPRKIVTLRANPVWALGSVHAVTEDGQVLIASNSGSNLPSYAYTAEHVIWVVGAQKFVKNIDEGIKRIYEHSLPLESVRARKEYHLPETWESYPSKILLYNREPVQGRTHMIIVKEVLGY